MNQVNVSCHIVKKKITNIKYKLDKAKYIMWSLTKTFKWILTIKSWIRLHLCSSK